MFTLNNNPRKKDQRTYRNVKYWPTQKLKEVLDDAPYYRGVDGHDYGIIADEIEQVYFERMNRLNEQHINEQLRQREFLQ